MTLKIALNEDIKKFSFSMAAKDLDAAISRAGNVIASAGSNVKNFILAGSEGKVLLLAYNPDTYVLMRLNGKSKGEGSFGFSNTTLQGVIKGRGDMEFEFNGSEFEFKQTKGKYAGKILTTPVTSDQISIINTKFAEIKKKSKDKEKLKLHAPAPSVLPRDVLNVLKEGVRLTGIKDVYTDTALLNYMQLNEKGILTVSAFDNHHFGYYKCKVDAGGMTFKAALPSSHFLIIDRMVEGTEATFHVMNESIRVEGEDFTLILPGTQADEKSFGLIASYIKELDKADFAATYDNDKLLSVVDNLFTLHSVNTSFEISHKAKGTNLRVDFNTANGSANDAVKVAPTVSNDIKAKVEPKILKDILGLFKGQKEATFSVIKDKVIRLDAKTKSNATVTLVSALSS
jgi:hypothetical protein